MTTDPTVDTCAATHTEPRRTADGLHVCLGHERLARTLLAELPGLHTAMLTPSRRAAGPRVTGTGARRIPISDDMVNDRERLRGVVADWTAMVAVERGITPPPDTIPARVVFLDRHLTWLLSHSPDVAGNVLDDLKSVTTDARRTAYPARSERIFIGRCNTQVAEAVGDERGVPVLCGAKLYAAPTDEEVICPDCGEWGTIGWWHDRLIDVQDNQPLGVPGLIAHLLMRYGRDVSTAQLWKWRERGKITVIDRDHRGRPLYDPIAVAAVATRMPTRR